MFDVLFRPQAVQILAERLFGLRLKMSGRFSMFGVLFGPLCVMFGVLFGSVVFDDLFGRYKANVRVFSHVFGFCVVLGLCSCSNQ